MPPSVPVDTSEEAAASMVWPAAAMRERIAARLEREGQTCDELEVLFGWKHQTVSARLWELERAGQIIKSAERRPTRSGRTARVYRRYLPSGAVVDGRRDP